MIYEGGLLAIFLKNGLVNTPLLTMGLGVELTLDGGIYRNPDLRERLRELTVLITAAAGCFVFARDVLDPSGLPHLLPVAAVLILFTVENLGTFLFRTPIPGAVRLASPFGLWLCLAPWREHATFAEMLVSTTGAVLGYLLFRDVILGLAARLDEERLPATFRGIPTVLLMLAILAMALTGLNGLL